MFQNDDIFEGCDFDKYPEPVGVGEGPNPNWQGLVVRDIDDFNPQGFTTVELNNVYANLCSDKHGEELVLECPSMEELEYYNPGTEDVNEDYILEAITVDQFSRTEKRMAAVVRTFNKHLSDTEIKALPPIVGKPKKSGTFAYVIVQLPFSDGQSVNVVFHSPEGDKKKIGANDAIIAFRWLLNKRDITQVVAPEDGAEVSLETIARRITQLVVKNSAKFEKQQKSAQAEREELEKAREDVKAAEDRQRELMDNIASGTKDAEALDTQLSSVLAQVENQKTINAELEAKIGALRKQTKHENETGGKGNSAIDTTELEQAFGPIYSEYSGSGRRGIQELLTMKKGYIPNLFNKPGIGPIGVPYGKSGSKGFGLAHIIERRTKEGFNGEDFVENTLPQIIDQGTVEERQEFPGRKYIVSKNGEAVIRLDWDSKANAWLVTAYPSKEETEALSQDRGSRLVPDYPSGKTPPDDSSTGNVNLQPSFVNDLNDIISGKYDANLDRIDQILDTSASQAEAAGNFDQYDDLFNQAADHLTELYKKKAGAM